MRHTLSLFLVTTGSLVFVLATPEPSAGQEPDPSLSRRISGTKYWQLKEVSARDVSRLLRTIKTGKPDEQKAALAELAMSRPTPAQAQAVISLAETIKDHQVDWVRSAGRKLSSEWKIAQKTAVVMQQVRRAGGYQALGRMIAEGSPKLQVQAVNALARTGDPEAAEILVEHFVDGPIHLCIRKGLEDMGPIAAPSAVKILDLSDWGLQMQGMRVLEEIGTKNELKALADFDASNAKQIVKNAGKKAAESIRKSKR